MMILVHKPKSKTTEMSVTVTNIKRDTLSLLLAYATDGLEVMLKKPDLSEAMRDVHEKLKQIAKEIDDHINQEDKIALHRSLTVEDE